MSARIMSLAVTPTGNSPSKLTRMVLGLVSTSVWVAITWVPSEVPMPQPMAPMPPRV
jgi:hypothetical protein